MATNDVPGAKASNNDKLARGCWAEHSDGSLIYVKDIDENDRVIFEIYDLSLNPPAYYPHALAKTDFENKFSWKGGKNGSLNIKWTWHDKTPFPWDTVMKHIDNPVPVLAVQDQLSAAQRVADSLNAKVRDLDSQHVSQLSGKQVRSRRDARGFMERVRTAISKLAA